MIAQPLRQTVRNLSLGEGVIATDAEGKVTFLNRVAEALTGLKAADCLGRNLGTFFTLSDPVTGLARKDPSTNVLEQGVTARPESDHSLLDGNGSRIPIDHSCAPIRDEKGTLVGTIVVFRDVSERTWREAEREKPVSELQLALASVKTLTGLLPL